MQVHGHQESRRGLPLHGTKFKTVTIEEQWFCAGCNGFWRDPLSLHFEIPIDRLDLQGRTI